MDNKKFVGAVLMDLSKAFDCVPHDLLIAKMHAYGFDIETLMLFFTYLKIGKYALVGAGSVVTKSVCDYALVVGNPALQIGWVCICGSRLKAVSL